MSSFPKTCNDPQFHIMKIRRLGTANSSSEYDYNGCLFRSVAVKKD